MYHRILTRVLDTPLLISQSKLDILSERVLLPMMLGEMVPKALTDGDRPARKLEPIAKTRTAVIPVMDTLFSKNGTGLSGATTYESISKQIDQAISEGANQIGFWIDSPGGESFGLFSLMEKIRNLPANGIATFSFTDGMMTSAAYGIASATQRIMAVEGSLVGSIGTVLTHIDRTEADNKAGLRYIILRSKDEKALGSSHEPFTEELQNRFKTFLDKMDTMFNNEILKGRTNLTLDSILQMKGSEFLATEGLQLGLVDEIVPTFDSAFLSFNKQPYGAMKMEQDELLQKLAAANAEVATMKVAAEQAILAAVQEERTRVLAVLASADTLGISLDMAVRHIEKGYSSETSLDIMTEIRETRELQTAIDSSTSLQSTAQDDAGSKKPDLKTAYRQAVGKRAA